MMAAQRDALRPASKADLEAAPKAELHLHLRGAVPVEFLRQRFRKHPPRRAVESAPAEQLAWMLGHPAVGRILHGDDPLQEIDGLFERSTFEQFLGAYLFTGCFVRDIEDFADLVRLVRQDLAAQEIVYAEITVSLPEYMQQGIALGDLLAVLSEDPPEKPRVRWIIDPVRNFGPDAVERLVEDVARQRPPTVIGLTLGGAEHKHPPAQFRRAYEIAKAGGLRATVHAGEALGPESVWDALRILGVERVGHGVRAIEDPALVRHLAERRIPLEVCPTSNIRTGVYDSLSDHPVRALYEAGVPICVSTDDPTFFQVSLAQELANLNQMGFPWREVGEVISNGFRMAFDPDAAARARAG